MRKIAIITDSNSGITQEQAASLDIQVVPMPFSINGTTYFEDITLDHETFYQLLSSNTAVCTSQPSIGDLMGLWEKTLNYSDEIVYIPMSSGLSGSCQTARSFAGEYHGRVQVVDNQRISVTQRQSVLDAIAYRDQGKSAAQIRFLLEECKFDSSIYIMVDDLKYLRKGGRITKAAATFAEILNLKPVLTIQGEKLDAFSKARGIRQARSIMIQAIAGDIKNRFHGEDSQSPTVYLEIAHTNNEKAANEFALEVASAFPRYDIHIDPLSLSVACHIGPGSLALACSKIQIQ